MAPLQWLKYGLAAFGGVLWIALWFQRNFWLGLAMLFIIVPAFWYEIESRRSTERSPAAAKPRHPDDP
jgi:hypothetical protein